MTRPLRIHISGFLLKPRWACAFSGCRRRCKKEVYPICRHPASSTCHVPRLPLIPGVYYLSVGCGASRVQLDFLPRASKLTVHEADVFGTGRLPKPSQGMVIVDATVKRNNTVAESTELEEHMTTFQPGPITYSSAVRHAPGQHCFKTCWIRIHQSPEAPNSCICPIS